MQKVILALMLGAASAFAPRPAAKASLVVYGEGKYDDQMWDMAAKKDVHASWDPNAPRSDTNFNPFERNPDGNGPDASGYYPGEARYKDPQRPNVDFASMMAEKEVMQEILDNPKAGDVPGAPGCYN